MPKSSDKNSETPELLHQLGRAVLSYSVKRLAGQDSSSSSAPSRPPSNPKSTARGKDKDKDHDRDRPSSRPTSGSKSRNRDRDRDHDRSSERRSTTRSGSRSQSRTGSRGPALAPSGSDSSDLNHLLGKVAVGLVGYGIKQYLHRRKVSKQSKGTDQPSRSRAFGFGFGKDGREKDEYARVRKRDPELAAALESLTTELEGTSRSLRKIAGRGPPRGHGQKNCEVYERLKEQAGNLDGGIERLRSSVNNVRNLHGGLVPPDSSAAPAGQTRGIRGDRVTRSGRAVGGQSQGVVDRDRDLGLDRGEGGYASGGRSMKGSERGEQKDRPPVRSRTGERRTRGEREKDRPPPPYPYEREVSDAGGACYSGYGPSRFYGGRGERDDEGRWRRRS